MNKYGLLVTGPVGSDKNIGDYIQSLAALQFIGKNFTFIEKEKVSEFNYSYKIQVIMNAWFMWHPEHWPPKEDCIDPLLISIHITPITATRMLANGGKEYFIKHGPVGCRDTGTLNILQAHGIPSYFSGCLTLTLGIKYNYTGKRNGIIFVDPYLPPIRYVNEDNTIYYPMNGLKSIGYFLRSPKKVTKLAKKSFFKGRIKLQTYYNASMFYHAYSSLFTDDILMNAEYISHMVPVYKTTNHESLLCTAEDLLHKYAKAKLVVTSRIHCALPCLGLETPLIFVLDKVMNSKKNIFNTPNRFGGLLDFFRVAVYNNNKVLAKDEELKKMGIISNNVLIKNKDNWRKYKDELIKKCIGFVNTSRHNEE